MTTTDQPVVGALHTTLRRVSGTAARVLDTRWTIAVAAAAAFVLRMPGLTRPVRADEAGFLLVARSWDPQPGSVYGDYFVDRPPLLIAVFRAADALGGTPAIRVIGALACALLVLTAAQVARVVADEHAARWTAVAMAALTTNTLIDAVAVKGELLGLPVLMASLWLSLLTLRDRSVPLALAAGALAGLALGFKQNLVGGLVFCAVLLLTAWLTRRISGTDLLRLGTAAALGAAVPVLATTVWALAAGVELSTLGYAVYGFRADAAAVLAGGGSEAPTLRAAVLVSAAVGAGMVLIIGGFLVHVRGEWADHPPVTAATVAVLLADTAALVAGGSFWRDYLFPLLPATALCAALLARRASKRGTAMRAVIAAAAASSLVCLVGWVAWNAGGLQEFDETRTGTAIGEVAEPTDTLVVFGGRADLQLTSGLRSPYAQLWSLPMRTLDPDLADLRALVAGPEAPTWLVEWVDFDTWTPEDGAALEALVGQRYEEHATGCAGARIFLLRGVEREVPVPRCG